MIEIPALIAILIAETLVLLVGFLVYQEYRRARKKISDRFETHRFIEKINDTQKDRLGDLYGGLIDHKLGTDFEACQENLEEIIRIEKLLYRQFFDAFLTHDSNKVRAIDSMFRDLTQPYYRLAKQLQAQKPVEEVDMGAYQAQIEALEANLLASETEVEQLRSHLGVATKSLKDISSEYTQMFSSYKGMDEVQRSVERMLDILRRAQRRAERINAKPLIPAAPPVATPAPDHPVVEEKKP